MAERLGQDFYARCTIDVARDLLGKTLVHRLPDGTRLSGDIVETEAYLGLEDPACHSFAGRRTPRTEPMFGKAGLSYVYFIYGVYFCFNVVTVDRDVPEAVLVRALSVREGVARIQARRPDLPLEKQANGPGKLCIALEIGRAQNALDLTASGELWIEDHGTNPNISVVAGPRIGIGDRHDAVHWPLRFGVRDHPALSPPRFES